MNVEFFQAALLVFVIAGVGLELSRIRVIVRDYLCERNEIARQQLQVTRQMYDVACRPPIRKET